MVKKQVAKKQVKTKKSTYAKNRKKKDVDYFTLSLFVLIIIALLAIAFNPQMISFNKKDKSQITIKESNYDYNGFNFNKEASIWYTQITKNDLPYIIMTENSPKEVEDINITYNHNLFPALTHSGDTIYLSFDPTEENKSDVTVAAVDFAKGLSIVYKMNIESACLINDTSCVQVQTCNTTSKAIIEIIRADSPRAEYKDNCLRVYGKDKDLIRVVNRLMFEWYGIIKVNKSGQVYRT